MCICIVTPTKLLLWNQRCNHKDRWACFGLGGKRLPKVGVLGGLRAFSTRKFMTISNVNSIILFYTNFYLPSLWRMIFFSLAHFFFRTFLLAQNFFSQYLCLAVIFFPTITFFSDSWPLMLCCLMIIDIDSNLL